MLCLRIRAELDIDSCVVNKKRGIFLHGFYAGKFVQYDGEKRGNEGKEK